jgi:DNA (cytosine-5)-methyltransferase 1
MRSVELFAGGGGLALGMAKAGFAHDLVLEWDHDACETIRRNQLHGGHLLQGWKVHEGDARSYDYGSVSGEISVVSGGPPCQPFSLGGKHKAYDDNRDMFPEAIRAVRELRPKAFIFENVKGLTREAFSTYMNYVELQMRHPEVAKRDVEDWKEHRSRLEKHHTSSRRSRKVGSALEYNVVVQLLNAADYGVPQKRERVFFVGFRSDLGVQWSFPGRTHSEERLLIDKYITQEYWERHQIARRHRPESPARVASRIARLSYADLFSGTLHPWRTIRDSILGLPDPERQPKSARLHSNHQFNPGARTYPGHTGSPIDEPSKTLKAGDHGVPGGENMLVRLDGTVRYFSVREAARLQTFPDDYQFMGSWSEVMRQLGNAVPVDLAEVVARSVADALRART